MKKVKGFGYDVVKHERIINHIDRQPNRSKYIWSLVEKDMNTPSIEELIEQHIAKHMEKNKKQ